MREIKFRAWSPKQNKMYGNITLASDMCWDKYQQEHINNCYWGNDSGHIIMQYTGLHDKNGKEIYEGDILVLTNPKCQIQTKRLLGIVIFLCASFGIEIKSANVWEGYNAEVEPPKVVWFLTIAALSTVEVIGDIYENPELCSPSGVEEK